MGAEVIETKRSPPIWGVKAKQRYRAVFSGANARAKTATLATEKFGEFMVKEKPALTRKQCVPEPASAE